MVLQLEMEAKIIGMVELIIMNLYWMYLEITQYWPINVTSS